MLITIESTTGLLEPVRYGLTTVVTPLRFVAEFPYRISDEVNDLVSSRDSLQNRKAALEQQVLELSQISQQYMALKAENDRLRELLGSRARLPAQVLVAELVGVIPAPDTHQVIIDKGERDDVRVGQAVIDAEGLFGQVVEIGPYTSRVLLLTDSNHAVPVQVNRNGVRSIAGGTGQYDRLTLENMSVTADIREGDLLETSGLGGRFPSGYPVGYVETVIIESTAAFATVMVRPTAQLNRSRHVLVVLADPNTLIAEPVQVDGPSAGSAPADAGTDAAAAGGADEDAP